MLAFNSRLFVVIAGFLFLISVLIQTVFPGNDPYRCRALLETGRWIDHPDKDGSRWPFQKWQPDGCMLHKYTSADIRQCLDGRSIALSGDSTTRQIIYGIGRLLERDEAIYDEKHVSQPQHNDFNLTYHGVPLDFYWNPYLRTDEHDAFVKQLELIKQEKEHPVPIKQQQGPAMAIFGVGAWFTKSEPGQGAVEKYSSALAGVSDVLGTRDDFFTRPMDPEDGIGNHVFFAPPAGPYYTIDQAHSKSEGSRKVTKELQDYLKENDDKNWWQAWAIPNMVDTQNKTIVDPKVTGWHVINTVAETKANLFLNLRCNARLDRLKSYPYSRTCCTDYGNKPLVQRGVILFGIVYLAACLTLEILSMVSSYDNSKRSLLNMETGSFAMAVLLCYYADRTQMFAKGMKLWSTTDFTIFMAGSVAIGLVSIRRSKPPRAKPGAPAPSPDQPFLSRDQTDEWKGWMQFVILIYHWTGSMGQEVYIFVRLLVAAYLFQTGYGHTSFFLAKKDFSFKRVASVLLRINLLPVCLAYAMNTDYMNYYFSPLVSFWFLIVYITMAVAHKSLNSNIQLVLAKICVSAVLITILMRTPLLRWLFTCLRIFFKIEWDVRSWEYRVSLDLFVVYVGMLTAVAYQQSNKVDVHLALRLSLALVGILAITGYALSAPKFASLAEYRSWHPYISSIPILAFVAVRNVSSPVRNYYSKAMAWLGQCSLETYTLQFHLLLAGDTEGVLLLGAFNGDGSLLGDRWRSLIFILPLFLWISSLTATATGNIVQFILKTSPSPPKEDLPRAQPLPTPARNEAPTENGTYKDSEATPLNPDVQESDAERKASQDSNSFYDVERKNHDSDIESLLHEEDLAEFTTSRYRFNRFKEIISSAVSLVFSLQSRVLLLLAVMWLLNLASPGRLNTPVPDGYTPHNAHN